MAHRDFFCATLATRNEQTEHEATKTNLTAFQLKADKQTPQTTKAVKSPLARSNNRYTGHRRQYEPPPMATTGTSQKIISGSNGYLLNNMKGQY